MPTALAEWTPERPDEPGDYWWRVHESDPTPQIVHLVESEHGWEWFANADDEPYTEAGQPSSLWWPVRLDPPPVG